MPKQNSRVNRKGKKVKQDLEPEATYNCLGMEDGNGSDHHKMKAKIQKEYKRRISLVLKSELNARNKIAAINKLAVPCSITQLWRDKLETG